MTRPVFSRTRATVRGVLLQRVAHGRGAPALPDNREVDGLARRPVPDERGLALVGDADRGDVLAADPGGLQRAGHARLDARPYLGRRRARPTRAADSAAGTRSSRGQSFSGARPRRRAPSIPVVPWSIASKCLAMDPSVGKEGPPRQASTRPALNDVRRAADAAQERIFRTPNPRHDSRDLGSRTIPLLRLRWRLSVSEELQRERGREKGSRSSRTPANRDGAEIARHPELMTPPRSSASPPAKRPIAV